MTNGGYRLGLCFRTHEQHQLRKIPAKGLAGYVGYTEKDPNRPNYTYDEDEKDTGFRIIMANGHPRIMAYKQSMLPTLPGQRSKLTWWVLDHDDMMTAVNPVQKTSVVADINAQFAETRTVTIESNAPVHFKYTHDLVSVVKRAGGLGPNPITGRVDSITQGQGLHLYIMARGLQVPHPPRITVHVTGWFRVVPAPFFGETMTNELLEPFLMSKMPVRVTKDPSYYWHSMFEKPRPGPTSDQFVLGIGPRGNLIKKKKKVPKRMRLE